MQNSKKHPLGGPCSTIHAQIHAHSDKHSDMNNKQNMIVSKVKVSQHLLYREHMQIQHFYIILEILVHNFDLFWEKRTCKI